MMVKLWIGIGRFYIELAVTLMKSNNDEGISFSHIVIAVVVCTVSYERCGLHTETCQRA